MKNKVKGFTLVELLAVIVILAVILVIAMPKISDVIKNSKEASLETTAKLIASQAEKKRMENAILENQNSLSCSDVAKLNKNDYGSCSIYFDVDNNALVTLHGSGKFEGLQIINGTKESAIALTYNLPEYGIGTEFIKSLYEDEKLRDLMGLEKDTTSDENIRYVGTNPSNYVKFNGETWRIIGVFGSNLKLVRDEILTTYSFDNKTTAQGIDSNYGTNDWANSYLREFLNDYYYEGKTITCHSENSSAVRATNAIIECPSIDKINVNEKNMIENSIWHLGGMWYKTTTPPNETYPVNELYEKERGTEVRGDHATTSTDYIGLIYPSDYGYASTDASCRQNLRAGIIYENEKWSGKSKCQNNNWLYKKKWYWTISPSSIAFHHMFGVTNTGNLNINDAWFYRSVLPSLYLKSSVKIVSGFGTSGEPYILEL
ncbi:MAG: type II secretion system protein [bacterium]|nr:type II secretion system protein [bacterium]